MTEQRSQLINFVSKFLGTVRFGNDQVARIMGYGDYQIRNVIIYRVSYVEGLRDNLFSVGQLCDFDLEVAFRKHTCFVHNLEVVDLLIGSRDRNLYTLLLDDMLNSSLICLLSKASKSKSWLWHQRLSHLNFGTINELAKQGLVRGLPKLNSELVQNPSSSTPYVPPTNKDWDILFQPMFDEYFQPTPNIVSCVLPAVAPIPVDTTGTTSSTSIDQDAPSASTSPTSHKT
ncbi:integrase, catalytic region, zinc finger, CCHC-type containing protein [Tanacetum coccineum]